MPTNFISEEEKEGKASIWSYVHLVTLLKIEGAMFSFIKTPEGITYLPITIYALLSIVWISGFTRFFAPPRRKIAIFGPNMDQPGSVDIFPPPRCTLLPHRAQPDRHQGLLKIVQLEYWI